jgi:drug/metabolite transporter (DMT)-like permease
MKLGFPGLVSLMAVLSTILALTQIFLRRWIVQFTALSGSLAQRVILSAKNPHLWIAGGCFLAGGLLWLWILPRVRLPVAYPMIGMSYVVMLFLGHFLEGEPISWINIVGVLLVVGGVALLGLER